jgi:phenylalanyl-tRNA synthetase beta chain
VLISLNWIRDFVDLPRDIDPRELAERFTVSTAEVEGVEHVRCDARGLVAAEVRAIEPAGAGREMFIATLNAGSGATGGGVTGSGDVTTVTQAKDLQPGMRVIYAPPGSSVDGHAVGTKPVRVGERTVESTGAILSGGQLAMPTIGERAIILPPSTQPGSAINAALLDDWIIEVDNKSITHRPDLWGHYGIAREIAATFNLPLRPYAATPMGELERADLPAIPIEIDDAAKCPRYSALRFAGVRAQPAPLWMQLRLAHVGLRPIDILVDLTNYIMVELGQPMHAFDAAGIDRIEVAVAKPGEKFTTLDGVQRSLPEGALMIQSHRRSVALAGVMGGAETEIKPGTSELLLESANFEPATIRRCAAALGHRTDASARFEKSLDPANTVLAIQRFVYLARPELPAMKITSRLSDAFPAPPPRRIIRIDPQFVARYIGRPVPLEQIKRILAALEFGIREVDGQLELTVPSFRATKDITIAVDVIEEIARCVGYGSIEPARPVVTVRYAEPAAMSRLERGTLGLLCGGMSYAEIHRYAWFDDAWLATLGFDPGPTINLRNPAAAGESRMRTTLIPGVLSSVDLNRRNLERFELVEIGSTFLPGKDGGTEERHFALALVAPGRKPVHEDELIRRLKTDLETWARQIFGGHLRFEAAPASAPWDHEAKTAAIFLGDRRLGRLTVVPAANKRKIDEHLAAWSIALAEVSLSAVVDLPRQEKKLVPVPMYPQVSVDFSFLADAARQYAEIERDLGGYDHALLRRLAFVDSFEGGSVPAGKRSFTFRATVADPARTLTEADVQEFRANFINFLTAHQLTLRS